MGKIVTIIEDANANSNPADEDSGAGFVMGGGAAAPSGLAFGATSEPMTSIEQAEALGIDEQYDIDNEVLVWHFLDRFWKRSPNAMCWLMLVSQGTTLADMADKTQDYLYKLILDSEGKAKNIGLALNPASAYAPTVTSGIDDDAKAAVSKAQATIDAHAEKYRNVVVHIEARKLSGTAASMEDFRMETSRSVSLVALSDPALWAINALHESHGDVGTVVGINSAKQVNENGGWTEKFNLQDKANGFYLTVGMSDGKLAKTREAEYETLTNKGLTFGRTYAQQSGVYLNDQPSCADITSDYAYIPSIQTVNKAIIKTYDALFPKVNAPLKVDATTGHLDLEVVKSFEALAQRQLDAMQRNEEISGGKCYIDPKQDLKAQGKLIVVIKVVEVQTGRVIEVKIGLAKSI